MQRSMYAKLSSKEFLWIWESAKRSTSSQFVSRGVSLQSQWGKFVSIWLNSFSPIFNPPPSPSVLHSFIVWIINRNFFQPINMWKWKSNAEICKEYFVSDAVSSLTNQSVFFRHSNVASKCTMYVLLWYKQRRMLKYNFL